MILVFSVENEIKISTFPRQYECQLNNFFVCDVPDVKKVKIAKVFFYKLCCGKRKFILVEIELTPFVLELQISIRRILIILLEKFRERLKVLLGEYLEWLIERGEC